MQNALNGPGGKDGPGSNSGLQPEFGIAAGACTTAPAALCPETPHCTQKTWDPMHADDTTLVERTLAGDRGAFDDLVRRHSGCVFRIAHRFFREPHTIEDIAQEAFLQAYRALDTYSRTRPFAGWLSAVTIRTCYRELRCRRKRSEQTSGDLLPGEADVLERFSGSPWSAIPAGPEAQAICRNLVEKVLQHLTPREQMVLILTEVEGLNVRETAQSMGISSVNARVTAMRARRRALGITDRLLKKTRTGLVRQETPTQTVRLTGSNTDRHTQTVRDTGETT